VLDLELVILLLSLGAVAALYSSVGHGGGSGYIAILSLSAFALMDPGWLKQHAWSLNMVVAAISFYHFHTLGHHRSTLTIPFVLASIPMAFVGGYLAVTGNVYDVLLSLVLILAAIRLFSSKASDFDDSIQQPSWKIILPWGASIGLISGVIGIGGGILLSPLLMLKGWATPKIAAPTSAAFIWVNSTAGLIGNASVNGILLDLDLIIPAVPVVIVGGLFGSKLGSESANQSVIRKVLVAVLLFAAAKRLVGLVSF
jgi:uncharacterized membrane protein YfcA